MLLGTQNCQCAQQGTGQDGNGDAHLKAGVVGLSETIPPIEGQLGLSTWQSIFFCTFDGPQSDRRVVCTIIADAEAR